MIKGFLFDLDGTLVDTHRANFEAYKKAVADFDVHIGWDDFRATIGKSSKEFLPIMVPGLKSEQYDEINKLKMKYYRELLHLTIANEPLIKFLKIMALHYPCSLVTTARRANAENILKHHGLSEVFKVIITGDDVEAGKPHPEGYLLALKQLELPAKDTIAFEDSETGKQAAEAAGIPVIMVREFVV